MIQDSPSKKLNIYDIYAGAREFAMLVVASLVVNINAVEEFLMNIGVPEVLATIILFVLAEIGRRYLKNYSPKS